MILERTIDCLKKVYRKKLEGITIERLVVGVFSTGVKLSNGDGGICYTPVEAIHKTGFAGSPFSPAEERSSHAVLKNTPVSEILNHRVHTPLRDTIRLAAVNALSHSILSESPALLGEGDPLDLIDLRSMRKIAMVGAIRPFLDRLKKMDGIELSVIEKKQDSLAPREMGFFVPPERTWEILSGCDLALITGATVANGTIEGLLKAVNPDAMVVVAGPTASFLPDILFERGVDMVSGALVIDPDRALDMISEGCGAYPLFPSCLKKFNLLKKSYKRLRKEKHRGKETVEPAGMP